MELIDMNFQNNVFKWKNIIKIITPLKISKIKRKENNLLMISKLFNNKKKK
jgi:hypothetical protein